MPTYNQLATRRSSRQDLWRQFSAAIHADYQSGQYWFSESRVCAEHRNWTIVLDTYLLPGARFPVASTRFHVPYISTDNFRLSLRRKWIAASILKSSAQREVEFDSS